MTNPSLLRRTYDAVALFSMVNLLGLGALGIILFNRGALNSAKGRRILAVLRGQDLAELDRRAAGAAADHAAEQPDQGTDVVTESEVGIEIMRREGERIKAELDQRLALNNSILLRVTAERDRIKHDRDELAREREASMQQRRADGFKKQIAIYESLKPKVAVHHLLALAEPDEAARILVEMNTGRARKIVEAAKEPDQLSKMLVILRRVREVAPERSAELDSMGG